MMPSTQHTVPALEQIRAELCAMLPELRQQWPILSLGVFESYARGEHRPGSDLDLLVEFSRPVVFVQFIDLETEISRRLGLRVELVTKAALKPHIGRLILAELVSV